MDTSQPLSYRHSLFPTSSKRNNTPDFSDDQERSSPETQTIFTIYSMYGDDTAASRASSSASEDIDIKGYDPTLTDTLNDSRLSSRHSTNEPAYTTDILPSDLPPHKHIVKSPDLDRSAVGTSGSNSTRRLQASRANSRESVHRRSTATPT